ncbi:MBL fold metallo-hydrolase [Fulvivirga lutimaris]|uniref:MBL fold metallo-hydrolase n=1 Tax=Fulvivirga lutimaris TaxID=1819566 RepID=UPI0012BB9517|nr:MBL fold metallo-hydrolase [Fulvivirga lutimaris]MTI38895.1 MBL fold metallo-hydrolase [Fulvivirga lutimaris]
MKHSLKTILAFLIISHCAMAQPVSKSDAHKVSSLKVTTLSTMLANSGIGEWGYAALIEVDGKKLLFDTGSKHDTVLKNARDLGVDLSVVEDVFLSHNHGDHVGGLLTLREELKKENPNALKRVHVGKGIFLERVGKDNKIWAMKEALEKDGVEFVEHDSKAELFPGMWITGPVVRIYDERNWSGSGKIKTEDGIVEDNIPEDQSIAITTADGFVLISGCGHAGVINTMQQIRTDIYEDKFFAAIGGFHLIRASDEHIEWTAGKMKEFGLENLNGAHCTGINALYDLRRLLGLDKYHAVVGSVGDTFDLENGIDAGLIAR